MDQIGSNNSNKENFKISPQEIPKFSLKSESLEKVKEVFKFFGELKPNNKIAYDKNIDKWYVSGTGVIGSSITSVVSLFLPKETSKWLGESSERTISKENIQKTKEDLRRVPEKISCIVDEIENSMKDCNKTGDEIASAIISVVRDLKQLRRNLIIDEKENKGLWNLSETYKTHKNQDQSSDLKVTIKEMKESALKKIDKAVDELMNFLPEGSGWALESIVNSSDPEDSLKLSLVLLSESLFDIEGRMEIFKRRENLISINERSIDVYRKMNQEESNSGIEELEQQNTKLKEENDLLSKEISERIENSFERFGEICNEHAEIMGENEGLGRSVGEVAALLEDIVEACLEEFQDEFSEKFLEDFKMFKQDI